MFQSELHIHSYIFFPSSLHTSNSMENGSVSVSRSKID